MWFVFFGVHIFFGSSELEELRIVNGDWSGVRKSVVRSQEIGIACCELRVETHISLQCSTNH